MRVPLRVLHLEDSPRDAEVVRHKLDAEGVSCDILLVNSKESFEAALTRELFDLILSDYNLPGYDGISALKYAQRTRPDVPVILISGTVGDEEGVRCLHLGATDYLLKGRLERLAPAVERAIQEAETQRTRRLTEEKLRQSERLNRSLVEHLPQRIFVKDRNLKYVFCNAAYARDLGIEPTQIVGKDDFAFFSRELAEAYRAEDRQVMTNGKNKTLDERHAVAGTEMWFGTLKVPYRDERGEIIGVLGLFEDISERKAAEVGLQQLAAIVEAADDAIISTTLDGTVLTWNPAAERLFGYRHDEMVGRSITVVIPGDRQGEEPTLLKRVVAGERIAHYESIRVRKDGSTCDVSLTVSPLSDQRGVIIGASKIVRDITARKQAEKEVETAEERMRFALEAASVGIWDMDCTTRRVRLSEVVQAQYGLQPGTFRGTFEAYIECIHPDDRNSMIEAVEKAMKSGDDFSVPHRTRRPDGTVRFLNGTGRFRLDEHGEAVRGVGISQDVTERRALEEQYQQAQKMEAIGRLAAGVAHDFNNLLTVILGFCELLLADLDAADPHRADIAEIEKAGARAAGLTRQLLIFSRKEIIQPTLLDVNVIVADMRVMLGRLIGEDVDVVLALGRAVAPVIADRGQVEQIVLNLAVNARDAMPKGGTLTIETANVEPDECRAKAHFAVAPGACVALTVTDTGTGITPDVRARLFEPFFTTKGIGKGTGLGLATVQSIVTRSGGSVTVDSEVGKGTSFTVYLPQADAAERVIVAPPPAARPPVGVQTVLVVEDAAGLREVTKRLLERLGYSVLVAANAEKAVQLFDRNPSIDVLLTDVVMPGASGPELVAQLVERRPTLKVIYMSGYTDEAITEYGVLGPEIAFLHKPFGSEALGRKIRELLDR